MYHTMLLFQPIHALDYPTIKAQLSVLSTEKKSRNFPDPICPDLHIYTLYQEYGIIIMLRRTMFMAKKNSEQISDPNSHGVYYHAIEIRLNPKVLIQANEYVKVARASDYNTVLDQFRLIMKPLQQKYEMHRFINVYRFNDITGYQVKRIDYCINIYSKLHEVYMELIRRADVPACFFVVKGVDKKSGKELAYKHSFYIQTKKNSVGVNIYDKEYQMHKEFDGYEHLEDSCNIIRLEIQCLNGKTIAMKQKYKWKYRDFANFADDDIARNMIYDYYEKTVGFEDYYTLEEARIRIKSDNYRTKTKKRLIEILELVNQKRSIHQARLAFREDIENNDDDLEFNSLIKKIRKSGINPVTIPVNRGYDHIPNLVKEMDKVFTQLLRVVIN